MAYPYIGEIIESLNDELSQLPSRMSAFASGEPLFVGGTTLTAPKLCYWHVHNCLEIIDGYLVYLRKGKTADKRQWPPRRLQREMITGLTAAIVSVDIVEREGAFENLQVRGESRNQLLVSSTVLLFLSKSMFRTVIPYPGKPHER